MKKEEDGVDKTEEKVAAERDELFTRLLFEDQDVDEVAQLSDMEDEMLEDLARELSTISNGKAMRLRAALVRAGRI